jgi:hypothetical protein
VRCVKEGEPGGRAPHTRVPVPRLWPTSPAAVEGLAVLVLLLAAAVIPLALVARQGVLSNLGQVVPFLPIAAVGVVIARHRPRNPIGWLLIATAASAVLTDDAQLYVWLIYRLGRHLPLGPVALLLAFTWFTAYVTLPVAILLFPDGALSSPRWRWVLWAYLTVTGFLLISVYAAVVSLIVAHNVRIDPSGDLTALDNPSGGMAWLATVHTVIFPVKLATRQHRAAAAAEVAADRLRDQPGHRRRQRSFRAFPAYPGRRPGSRQLCIRSRFRRPRRMHRDGDLEVPAV